MVVMLSNGNLHYFWDLERGNPYVITSFPTPDSVIGYQKVISNPDHLVSEQVGGDYIVLAQRPDHESEAAWRTEAECADYIHSNKLQLVADDAKSPLGQGDDDYISPTDIA
ncbi:MAG: hypothetical protein ACYC6T_03090 [Thermoleophilia bacterium]